MMCRYLTSNKGFSLVKTLLLLVILSTAILYFLPPVDVGSSPLGVINQIGTRVKGLVDGGIGKVVGLKESIFKKVDSTMVKVSRKIADLLDKWNFKKLSEQIQGVQKVWKQDMDTLLLASKNRGFNVNSSKQMLDEYEAGERSWRRVESFYWEDLREQTQKAIQKSFEHFLSRPIGCSDFSQELRTIWKIGELFNKDEFSGYAEAKTLSDSLYDPRSKDFLTELFEWLRFGGIYAAPPGSWEEDWFIHQLIVATDTSGSVTPDYPGIIATIEAQVGNHPLYKILGDITIAEIYLKYDLVNSAIQHYEEAIQELSRITSAQDSRQSYSQASLGLHMSLGLLHERMCSNADLASKEFKDVIAIARRLNMPSCDRHNKVHFHLAILNLQIKERATIQPKFVEKKPIEKTAEQLLKGAATPVPTSSSGIVTNATGGSSSTTAGQSETGEDVRPERPNTRALTPEPTPTPVPTYAYGEVKKGTIPLGEARRIENDIRLRPRQELGSSATMEKFKIEQLYNLASIPEDAVREFELYLKCQNTGEDTIIARYVLDKYHGK